MKKMTLGIIGGGNMGSAIATRAAKLMRVYVSDPDLKKISPLKRFGVHITTKNREVIEKSTVLLIALKPFVVEEVLREILEIVTPRHLVISIAAGIPLKTFQKYLKTRRLVRVMPNTPALIGKGFSGWHVSKNCTAADRKIVAELLETFGVAIKVNSEKAIDAITALSGSGPGYVFYFLEAFSATAHSLGFSKKESDLLALQTLLGSAELAASTKEPFEILRKRVTTPGGTTEAGLAVLQKKHWQKIFEEAARAAFFRAQKLGKKS